VLGDAGARRGADEGRRRRDIERVCAVAAVPTISSGFRCLHKHLGRKFTHDLGCRGDLAYGFLLDSQAGDDGAINTATPRRS